MAHETRREGSDRQRRAECIATRVLKHWSHRAAAAFDSSTISHRHHPTIIQEAGRGGNSTKPNKSTLLHMSSPPHFLASTASSYQHPLTIKHQPSTIVMTLSLINTDVADDTVADGRSKQAARTRRSAMAAPGGGSGVRDVAEEWRSWRKSGARGGRVALVAGGQRQAEEGRVHHERVLKHWSHRTAAMAYVRMRRPDMRLERHQRHAPRRILRRILRHILRHSRTLTRTLTLSHAHSHSHTHTHTLTLSKIWLVRFGEVW